MKERSLILEAHEVKGILAGAITEVKKPMKAQPKPGERMWCKERWHIGFKGDFLPGEYVKTPKHCAKDEGGFGVPCGDGVVYAEDLSGPDREHPEHGKPRWRSAYQMPRWAARIFIEVTTVNAVGDEYLIGFKVIRP